MRSAADLGILRMCGTQKLNFFLYTKILTKMKLKIGYYMNHTQVNKVVLITQQHIMSWPFMNAKRFIG